MSKPRPSVQCWCLSHMMCCGLERAGKTLVDAFGVVVRGEDMVREYCTSRMHASGSCSRSPGIFSAVRFVLSQVVRSALCMPGR